MANDDGSEQPVSPQQDLVVGSQRSRERPAERSRVYHPVLPGNVASELQQSINDGHPNLHSPPPAVASLPITVAKGGGDGPSQPPPVAPRPLVTPEEQSHVAPEGRSPVTPEEPPPITPEEPPPYSNNDGSRAPVTSEEPPPYDNNVGPGVARVPPPVAPRPVIPEISGNVEETLDPSHTGHFRETFVDQSEASLSINGDDPMEDMEPTAVEGGAQPVIPPGENDGGSLLIPSEEYPEQGFSGSKDVDEASDASSSPSSVPTIRIDDLSKIAAAKKSRGSEDVIYHTIAEEQGDLSEHNNDLPIADDGEHLSVYNTMYRTAEFEEGEFDEGEDEISARNDDGFSQGWDDEQLDSVSVAGAREIHLEGMVDVHQEDDVLEDEVFMEEEEVVPPVEPEEPVSYLTFFSRKLKAELNQLKKDDSMTPEDDGVCFRCRKELGFIFDSGEICPKCQSKVCKDCQVFTPTGKKWLCKYCDKQLQIKVNNPNWVGSKSNEDLTQPAIHGSELVRVALENSRANSTATSVIDENEDRKRYYEDDLSYSDEESESFGSEDYRRSPARNVTFDSPLRQSTIPSDLDSRSRDDHLPPMGSSLGTKHWHARSQGWGPTHPQFSSTAYRNNPHRPSEHLDNTLLTDDGHLRIYDFPDSYDFTVTHKVAAIKRTDDFSPLAPPFVWSGRSTPQTNSVDSGASLTCSTCSNGAPYDDIDHRTRESDPEITDGSGGFSDNEETQVNASTQTGEDLVRDVYLNGTVQEVDAPVDFNDYVVLDKVEEAFIFCNSDSFEHPRPHPRKLMCDDLIGHDEEMEMLLTRDSSEPEQAATTRKLEWNFLPTFHPPKAKKRLVPVDKNIFLSVDRARPLPESEPSSSSESSPLTVSDSEESSLDGSVVDLSEKLSDNVSFVQSLLSESQLSESRDENSNLEAGEGEGGGADEKNIKENLAGLDTEDAISLLDAGSSQVSDQSKDTVTSDTYLSREGGSPPPPRRKLLKAPTLTFADFEEEDEGSDSAEGEEFVVAPPDPYYMAYRLQASSESDLSVILEDPEEDRPTNNKTVSEESEIIDEDEAEADRYYEEDQRDYSTPYPGERVPVDVHPHGKNGTYQRASPTPKRVIDTTPRLRGDEWEQMLNGKLKDASEEEEDQIMEEKSVRPMVVGVAASAGGVGVNNNEGEPSAVNSRWTENGNGDEMSERVHVSTMEVDAAPGSTVEEMGVTGGANGVAEGDTMDGDYTLVSADGSPKVKVEIIDPDDSDMVVINYSEITKDEGDDVSPSGTSEAVGAATQEKAVPGDQDVKDHEVDVEVHVPSEAIMEQRQLESHLTTDDLSTTPIFQGTEEPTLLSISRETSEEPAPPGSLGDEEVSTPRSEGTEGEAASPSSQGTEGAPAHQDPHDTKDGPASTESLGSDVTGKEHTNGTHGAPYPVAVKSSTLPASADRKQPLGLDEGSGVATVRRSGSAVEARIKKGDSDQSSTEEETVLGGKKERRVRKKQKKRTTENRESLGTEKGVNVDKNGNLVGEKKGQTDTETGTEDEAYVKPKTLLEQACEYNSSSENGSKSKADGETKLAVCEVGHGRQAGRELVGSGVSSSEKGDAGIHKRESSKVMKGSDTGKERVSIEERGVIKSGSGHDAFFSSRREDGAGEDHLSSDSDLEDDEGGKSTGRYNTGHRPSEVTEQDTSPVVVVTGDMVGQAARKIEVKYGLNPDGTVNFVDSGEEDRETDGRDSPGLDVSSGVYGIKEVDSNYGVGGGRGLDVNKSGMASGEVGVGDNFSSSVPGSKEVLLLGSGDVQVSDQREDKCSESSTDGVRLSEDRAGCRDPGSSAEEANTAGEADGGRIALTGTRVPSKSQSDKRDDTMDRGSSPPSRGKSAFKEVKVELHVDHGVPLAKAESLYDDDFLIAALDQANAKAEFDVDVGAKVTRGTPPTTISKSNSLPYKKRVKKGNDRSVTLGRSATSAVPHNQITNDYEAHRTSTASLYSNAEESYRLPVTGDVNFGTNYNYKTNTFEVKVLSCRDLVPVDAKRNKSNAYVKLYLLPDRTKASKRKTHVKKGTINPVFSETLKYKIMQSELETRTLCVAVWHYDRFGHNLFLGEHLLSLDTVQFDEYLARWHPLSQRQRHSTSALTYTGDVLVAIMYEPLSELEEDDQGGHYTKGRKNKAPGRMLGGTLNVQVKEAKNLVGSKLGGAPSPACKCYLLPDRSRPGKKKTTVKKSTCNPKWSDILKFENVTRDSLLERCLEVTVFDYDTVGSGSCMGGVRLGLGSNKSYGKAVAWMDSSGKEVSVWREMLKHPNHWVETFMTLRGNVGGKAKK